METCTVIQKGIKIAKNVSISAIKYRNTEKYGGLEGSIQFNWRKHIEIQRHSAVQTQICKFSKND